MWQDKDDNEIESFRLLQITPVTNAPSHYLQITSSIGMFVTGLFQNMQELVKALVLPAVLCGSTTQKRA